ncbi:sulfite exporter TauE/SafE family protein [Desulfobotulus sp. H1]|uniref:Probable membrane transporter protein n=1 Tax=Desulfobotulus pelophilus TaxID=2823377 RepID=A0ABT3N5C4_9BACT|nr:sulfite exporter TauE/SafE family protein [Desulfobotulus pelophilus]MCW7752666.1 sulfite exporter TauE/SafE family protein [Desulfobotulus pelophilus]
MLETFALYLLLGAIAGVLAGLLGIGGGLVVVPMLVFALPSQGVEMSILMQLALGTSMAAIIFTATSSLKAHHKRGAVRWDVVWRISPGIVLGTFLGALVASRMPTMALKIIFIVFLYYVALQMFLNKKPKASRTLPGITGMFGAGCTIGGMSSLVGIGGGTLSVPFMTWCNLPFHTVIGTSAAIGLPIALAGTAGYVVGGLGNELLPPLSLGFVYGPALIGIVGASVLTAPLGVRLAHSLPVNTLKRFFAALLILVATRMLVGLL